MTSELRQILHELARGERRRLGRLIDLFGEELMSYLLAITGNRETAEDVFQDTWVRVMERIECFDLEREFAPWLFTVARHRAYDLLRRRRFLSFVGISRGESEEHALVPVDGIPFERRLIDADLAHTLLTRLEPSQREIIWLRYWRELSYEEIARHCGLRLGTVKSRLFRALRQLETLAPEPKEPPPHA